jgi:hypothetical protein
MTLLKEPHHPMNRRLGAQQSVWNLEEEKNLFPLPGIVISTVQLQLSGRWITSVSTTPIIRTLVTQLPDNWSCTVLITIPGNGKRFFSSSKFQTDCWAPASYSLGAGGSFNRVIATGTKTEPLTSIYCRN